MGRGNGVPVNCDTRFVPAHRLVGKGQKIEAIKHYREAMSVSLAEAKSVIEEAQRRAGLVL